MKKRSRRADILKKFGLTERQYSEMARAQGFKCWICREADNRHLCVDHDHETGEVRGLLCTRCNAGLGYFRDSVLHLEQAQKYLDHYRSK